MDLTDKPSNLVRAEQSWLRGRSAELLVAAWACQHGWGVALALSVYSKYDLIIDRQGRLLRTQVKLARWTAQRQRVAGAGDRAHWRVDLASDSQGRRRRYTHEDFDILAMVCEPERIYFLPMHELLAEHGDIRRCVRIKPEDETLTRTDAKLAGDRWTPYRNSLEWLR